MTTIMRWEYQRVPPDRAFTADSLGWCQLGLAESKETMAMVRGVYEPSDEVRVFDGAEDDDDSEGSRLPLVIVLALIVLAVRRRGLAGLYQGVARAGPRPRCWPPPRTGKSRPDNPVAPPSLSGFKICDSRPRRGQAPAKAPPHSAREGGRAQGSCSGAPARKSRHPKVNARACGQPPAKSGRQPAGAQARPRHPPPPAAAVAKPAVTRSPRRAVLRARRRCPSAPRRQTNNSAPSRPRLRRLLGLRPADRRLRRATGADAAWRP